MLWYHIKCRGIKGENTRRIIRLMSWFCHFHAVLTLDKSDSYKMRTKILSDLPHKVVIKKSDNIIYRERLHQVKK